MYMYMNTVILSHLYFKKFKYRCMYFNGHKLCDVIREDGRETCRERCVITQQVQSVSALERRQRWRHDQLMWPGYQRRDRSLSLRIEANSCRKKQKKRGILKNIFYLKAPWLFVLTKIKQILVTKKFSWNTRSCHALSCGFNWGLGRVWVKEKLVRHSWRQPQEAVRVIYKA